MDETEFFASIKDQLAKFPTWSKSSAYIYDQFMGFYHAVAWSKEPWLLILMGIHGLLLVLVIFGRNMYRLQVIIFLGCTLAVFASEQINSLAGSKWREFSTQNYFDKHGVFMGTVFSAPLLVILTVQLLVTLATASQLVVAVKRHEFGIEKSKKKDQ